MGRFVTARFCVWGVFKGLFEGRRMQIVRHLKSLLFHRRDPVREDVFPAPSIIIISEMQEEISLANNAHCIFDNESGAGIALYSTFLGVSFLICGMVVNLGFAYSHGEQLQHALDATAISAGELAIDDQTLLPITGPSSSFQTYVDKMFALNLSRNGVTVPSSYTQLTTITPVVENGATAGMTLGYTLSSPVYFTNLIQPSVSRSSTYRFSGGGKPVIVSLVMDVSIDSTLNSPTELATLKAAATSFVDSLSVGDYFGLVGFGRFYCPVVPLTKVLATSGQDGKTKAEIATLISTGLVINCGAVGATSTYKGLYLQGALYKSREQLAELKPTVSDKWNSYSKYIVVRTGCQINRSSLQGWPLSDSFDLDSAVCTAGSYTGQCGISPNAFGVERNTRAAALHQADLARKEGMEIYVLADDRRGQCTNTTYGSERLYSLRRLADDSSWNNASYWETDNTRDYGGYGVLNWCTSGLRYSICTSNDQCDLSAGSGDGTCSTIVHSNKQRLWMPDNATDLSQVLASRAGSLKHGRLVP